MSAASLTPTPPPSGIEEAQPHGPQAPRPTVDLNVLKAIVGDAPLVMADLLQTFRDSAHRYSAALAHAASAGKRDEVAGAAHKLKSCAAAIGAARLSQVCADIDDAALAGRLDAMPKLLSQLQDELTLVLRCLDDPSAR